MLRSQGHRVGLYTSPHLVSFTERIQVNGVPVAETAVAAWTSRLEEVALATEASFFEITTAIAFADFAARGVEIAVVEVGLGGRLDATNVIEPLVAGVTRIALEHTEYLGHDLAGIAREKAGIAKPGVPFLTTECEDALVQAMADSSRLTADRVPVDLAAGYQLGLRGSHQIANASLALAMARVLPEPWRPDEEAIRSGLAAARLPGRFDRRGPWIFDVAHNPDGVRSLALALRAEAPKRPLVAVVAVLGDKAWREMLALLGPEVDQLILTRAPSAPVERAWDLEEARTAMGNGQWAMGRAIGTAVSVEPDFAAALAKARAEGATALVTGSFHTVGDAMQALGIDP
jgi:dihydrofolate synthase/folylpolyglutamate synthase